MDLRDTRAQISTRSFASGCSRTQVFLACGIFFSVVVVAIWTVWCKSDKVSIAFCTFF